MTELDVMRPTSPLRRGLSILFFAVALVYGAIAGYGSINPRHYVILDGSFHDPVLGALGVIVLMLVAWVLGFPVRSSVIDRRRSQVRTILIILTIISVIGYAFVYTERVYRYHPRTLAISPSGQRSVVLLHGYNYTVEVFAGSGVAKRDMGGFGVPCGLGDGITAKFISDDEVTVSTVYNDYDFHLTPAGVPLGKFGPTCYFILR